MKVLRDLKSDSEVFTDRSLEPFSMWSKGVEADRSDQFEISRACFKEAAQAFFDSASTFSQVSRAYLEFSTVMDAFSLVQEARILIKALDFDGPLALLSKAAAILRATIHFGFLSPYVAACSSLDVADTFEESDEDRFQAYRNSIALFEQSKLALSFRDENHGLNKVIDAYIKYSMSKALQFEAILATAESKPDQFVEDKARRSQQLRKESEHLLARSGVIRDRLDYFPIDDYFRAMSSAFIVGYPDAESLWILNIGINEAKVIGIGNVQPEDKIILPNSSFSISLGQLQKMKIRLFYTDNKTGRQYEEGCISLV